MAEEERLSKKIYSERKQKQREMLAAFLYDVAKLCISGVGIGGFSPLVTGNEMNIYNYTCVIGGLIATLIFVNIANNILKPNVKF